MASQTRPWSHVTVRSGGPQDRVPRGGLWSQPWDKSLNHSIVWSPRLWEVAGRPTERHLGTRPAAGAGQGRCPLGRTTPSPAWPRPLCPALRDPGPAPAVCRGGGVRSPCDCQEQRGEGLGATIGDAGVRWGRGRRFWGEGPLSKLLRPRKNRFVENSGPVQGSPPRRRPRQSGREPLPR